MEHLLETTHVAKGLWPITVWVQYTATQVGVEDDGETAVIDYSTLRFQRWAAYDSRPLEEQTSMMVTIEGVGSFAVQDSRFSSSNPPASNSDWNNINRPTSDALVAAGVTLAAVSFSPRAS